MRQSVFSLLIEGRNRGLSIVYRQIPWGKVEQIEGYSKKGKGKKRNCKIKRVQTVIARGLHFTSSKQVCPFSFFLFSARPKKLVCAGGIPD